jgi:hypothetical protein
MGMDGLKLITSKEIKEESTQQWDTQIRNKLKRGAVVGDPGFGYALKRMLPTPHFRFPTPHSPLPY